VGPISLHVNVLVLVNVHLPGILGLSGTSTFTSTCRCTFHTHFLLQSLRTRPRFLEIRDTSYCKFRRAMAAGAALEVAAAAPAETSSPSHLVQWLVHER